MPTRLQISAGFILVMLIWSTTPLAIKWSVDGPGFLFAVTARMIIGMSLMLCIAYMKKVSLPWHRQAILTYLSAGMGIYGAMLAVYWGSQYIPSGFISVIFGMTPIMTGLLAWVVLRERELTPLRLFGMLIGIFGLFVIFNRSIKLGDVVMLGIAAVCLAVFIHALSSVLVKRLHVDLSALTVTTGGMLVATPAYLITWLLLDGEIPTTMPSHAFWSIIYLGVIATSIGFSVYFYILKHMRASQVGMLTLITPVMALWIGQLLNHEAISASAWLGTALILAGMGIYQWGNVWLSARKSVRVDTASES